MRPAASGRFRGRQGRRLVGAVRPGRLCQAPAAHEPQQALAPHVFQAAQRTSQVGTDGALAHVYVGHVLKYVWAEATVHQESRSAGSNAAAAQPSRQAAVDLQRLQMRSPGQVLSKRSRHMRQRRTLESCGSLGPGLLRVACFMGLYVGRK